MQNNEAKKQPHEVTIIIDGTPHSVRKGRITFEEVVTLAHPDFPQHPEITYSVRYKHGPAANHEGILSPGGSVEVKNEMIFYVKRTGQS